MKPSTLLLLAIHELIDNLNAEFEKCPGCLSIHNARYSNGCDSLHEHTALEYFRVAFDPDHEDIGYWFMVEGMPTHEVNGVKYTFTNMEIHPDAEWYPTAKYVYAARIYYMRKAYRMAIERGD